MNDRRRHASDREATQDTQNPPPLFRTFQNPNLVNENDRALRSIRVDIEIIRGLAFV